MRILFLQHFRLILDRFVIIIVFDEEVFSRFITNVYVEYSFSSSLESDRIGVVSSAWEWERRTLERKDVEACLRKIDESRVEK